jgi:hypothetical protein
MGDRVGICTYCKATLLALHMANCCNMLCWMLDVFPVFSDNNVFACSPPQKHCNLLLAASRHRAVLLYPIADLEAIKDGRDNGSSIANTNGAGESFFLAGS